MTGSSSLRLIRRQMGSARLGPCWAARRHQPGRPAGPGGPVRPARIPGLRAQRPPGSLRSARAHLAHAVGDVRPAGRGGIVARSPWHAHGLPGATGHPSPRPHRGSRCSSALVVGRRGPPRPRSPDLSETWQPCIVASSRLGFCATAPEQGSLGRTSGSMHLEYNYALAPW